MNTISFYILMGGGLGLAASYLFGSRSIRFWLKHIGQLRVFGGVLLTGMLTLLAGCGSNSAAMNESTANVKHITDGEFDTEVLQSSQPVVVDCYATWCGPCRQLAPIVESLAEEYSGKVKFVKVNVDDSPKVSQKFQIQAIPTLLFFKDGKLESTSVGLRGKAELTTRLDNLLAGKSPTTAPAK
jgi:thioredoxin 1